MDYLLRAISLFLNTKEKSPSTSKAKKETPITTIVHYPFLRIPVMVQGVALIHGLYAQRALIRMTIDFVTRGDVAY